MPSDARRTSDHSRLRAGARSHGDQNGLGTHSAGASGPDVKEGNSNRMVARLLGISERTVKVHLHSIFIKRGAASRTEAVIEGIRSGCISLH
ncbi:response regulator transcription factor [Streptomyces sp. NPDC088812]|uniref:response regulator transcription factor n=1 Tax=Streptomyces sp. NPDC088812 TaxID=3365905 RepID=UPI003808063A